MMLLILFAGGLLARINLLPLFSACHGLGTKLVLVAAQLHVLLGPYLLNQGFSGVLIQGLSEKTRRLSIIVSKYSLASK